MTRRRDDPLKQWDKLPNDHDPTDRRRNRSATLPSNSYDQRSYPSHYNDPRQPSRSHYPTTAQAPPTSKAYQHATRPSAQHPSSGYHYPQPSSYQPPAPAYPTSISSRRPHTDPPDPRPSRRPAPPTHQPTYDQASSGEEMPRPSRHTSRAAYASTQPPLSAPPNQAFWTVPRDVSSRRHKDPHRDQGRERDRDRDRDKPTADLENRYKDRSRTDRPRERERDRDRATDVRYQDQSRTRPHDRRKESDTEAVLYSEQRNASKASLSGREGHPSSSIRESSNGHRRHRTEDGTTSTGRRHQPETTQNPITAMPSQSTSVPQPDVQQTGEPPPAPLVTPVYLPSKAKSQRSYREGRPSTTQGAQSGSDTERTTAKYRMERTYSGPAVQRGDGHPSTSTRDRGNHDMMMGPRDDQRRPEAKYGVHQDARQPLIPINVDIPLVTPGVNASALPTETRASTVPQIVSIRAGQGPSDPHDTHFKSSAISHSDAPQDIVIYPPHQTSASIVKPSSHSRLQSDRPVVVEHPRAEPHGDDLPPGQRMSIHESARAMTTPISKSHSHIRGSSEAGADHPSSSYPSRPPSRSTHRTSSNAVPPAVVGPRPLRSVSQGPQTNESPTRPPSVGQLAPVAQNQYSVPPSPAHPTNGSSPKATHSHGILSSAQPSPKHAQFHGVSLSHSTSTQQAPSVVPSAHPTPTIVPQTLSASSRPPTRDGTRIDVSHALLQSADRPPTTDDRPGLQQMSNGTTVKASWVVQTPVTAKKAKISREEKYLRDHHLNSETPRAQLRQVLSQDDDPFPRASSSMMKASQAATPSSMSQRYSPGMKARDDSFGTPRGTLASSSPRSGAVKEAPTPERVSKQNLSSYLAGPPQIAVVGATPVTVARDLPQGGIDHAFLAPPFPAPTVVSRTTSNSQDSRPQPLQPAVRDTSSPSSSYRPQLVPAVHAPSLFQPYQPPSPPEGSGQFSPPPLMIPPPKGPEDSPPPPIETRTSEIIPTRSQTDGDPQSLVRAVPEVHSEMLHIPSQPSFVTRAPQAWQTSKPDSNTVSTPPLNVLSTAHADAGSLKSVFAQHDDVREVYQDIIPVLPSQSPAPPAKSRPKVTIEDVPEDSPVLSKAIPTSVYTIAPSILSRPQPLQHVTAANSPSKSVAVDHKSSPQSRSKDPPLQRSTDPSAIPTAPPMPLPISVPPPMTTRMPSSTPPTHPTFVTSTQASNTQRATNTMSSRPHQRGAEMLLASKPPAGINSGIIGSVTKPTVASVQTNNNPVSAITGQPQLVNGASVQGPSVSRFANAPTTTPHPSASATIATTKITPHTTSGSGPSVSALGLHIPAPSTNTQPPSAPDPPRQQPTRPGTLSIPLVDTTSTTMMSTTAVKNAYQEHPTVDSTRPRDVTPSATRHLASSSQIYATSSRPGTSSATTQQTPVTPAQPQTHHRVVSLPISSSAAVQRPLSPRKYSQPIPPTTVSTQPFPSRPPVPESHPTRGPTSAYILTPAPVRSTRLPPPDRTYEFDMLKTPSSIAPSPMLSPDTSNAVSPPIAVPIRARQPSTDSKDDKKKPSGLFGLFRTRTLSSKAVDPPVVSTATRASVDQGRGHADVSAVAPTVTPTSRGVIPTSAAKEWNSTTPLGTSTRAGQFKGRAPHPVAFPPPPNQAVREQKDATPHIFTPFKFLHSKRNRTVSAASLDVCDGNTATNTVIGSPDHSAISQAQALPRIIPPDVRDPLLAASEWRDREEAERRERRTHRIRRPGVTFDVEEEPPSPAPGTANVNKRKKLVRRPSGRGTAPGPPRG